ncbi:hypothetical protein [Sphingomonas sp. Leaf412]|uniref:hypothetical protein n=1 Tax=Sphingomonas sp. Leaf412 TaxID=1736370 RepID=UPI0012E3976B|nr:hypothetical protein [Sphingomonas sp. Leaf412]
MPGTDGPPDAGCRTIAGILLAACPPGIDRAWIEAVVEDGHVRAEYRYRVGDEVKQPAVAAVDSFRIAQALAHVQEGWPPPSFSTCVFAAFPDGRVTLDVTDAAPPTTGS